MILPETISMAANGPVVRQGDGQWANIVRWTLNALIAAEELGITAANVEQVKDANTRCAACSTPTANPVDGTQRLCFTIKAVGNYGNLSATWDQGAPTSRNGPNRL
jgi:general L-amino acid transport system substrate-binding protein